MKSFQPYGEKGKKKEKAIDYKNDVSSKNGACTFCIHHLIVLIYQYLLLDYLCIKKIKSI